MEKKKILIVDDETAFVHNVKTYFDMHGYECFTANNGKEGLEQVRKNDPDLVLLDILMPNMDGYTMIREVKKQKNTIKCIVITGKSKLKDLFELERVDRFMTKPFELSELKIAVDKMLSDHESESKKKSTKSRILVIDDEEKLVAPIKEFLERQGYEVAVCYSGEEGLETADSFKPDVVVTDIIMPGIDGYSMLKEMCKKDQNIRIIVMSAREKISELIQMEGIEGFLQKPFELNALNQAIQSVLAK